jgi:tetraacyldisaccharide 4'-kinase
MRDPAFWWRETSAAATLLAPASGLYGAIAAWRMARPGRPAPVPVVCVGNFTVGGAGKTPAAIAIARLVMAAGHRPFFLSRGYGGRLAGPVRVGAHLADEVGDEARQLARVAPTIVARDRPAGAAAAGAAGADLVIMDDGLQNPSIAKDLCIALVDGRRGIGNGLVCPAGPLRAPLAAQLDRVDALLLVGAASAWSNRATAAGERRGLPVLHGELRPDPAAAAALAGKPALAFAGIADPDKFFATLDSCGIPAVFRARFPDHHRFAKAEIAGLLARADRERLTLVTTEKDVARMSGDPAAAELLARTSVLPVTLTLAQPAAMERLVLDAITSRNRCRGAAYSTRAG